MMNTLGSLPGGAADASARIAAIQARIGSLTAAYAPGDGFASALGATGGAGSTTTGRWSTLTTSASGVGAARTPASAMSGGPTRSLPTGAWVQQLPPAGRAIASSIEAAAREAGIDPALLASVVRHESNFDQSVVSRSGAIGLAQLMPGTAEWLGVDPHDPEQNLRGGARYLREQLDRFGSVDLAVAAYNAGPNAVARAGGIPQYAETQAYVPRVLATYQEWT